MDPITATAGIIAIVVVLFVWNRLPVVFVAIFTSLALWATGVLDLNQALAGFGDPAVIFIASASERRSFRILAASSRSVMKL